MKAAITFFILFLFTSNAFAEGVVVAEVNGEKIYEDTLLTELSRQVGLTTMKLSAEQTNTLKRRILENLVERSLLKQAASGTNVEEKDVSKKVEEIKSRIEDFDSWLELNKYTEESFKTAVRDEMVVTSYLTKDLVDKVSVSEEEVDNYYRENADKFDKPEQVRARHILVKVPSDASEEEDTAAKKKIENIKKMAMEKDFAEVAKSHSEGPSKSRGGDLGYFTFNQMVKPFSEAAFATAPGEISDVVKTKFGYHIIKVEDKKAPEDASLKDIKPAIEQQLFKQKSSKLIEQRIQELKDKAEVVIYIN